MADSTEPILQTCTACGALIDVTDEEPFALMHCPACGTAQRVRRSFDAFELQEILGAGGMGAVYRALDTNLNRTVALKLLRKEFSTDQEFVKQFEKEASITASINHPNVVKVYTAGQDHGLVYIAMELVDKGSLDDLMNLQGRVAEAQVLEVGIHIAKGLNAALQRGLIHRDVKPGNILFADAHSAKIVDFGLAVLQEHAGTVAGDVWGTPYYVAPEKLDHQPEDFRSDLYSLGATLFHAVAGRPPFEAETASMVALKHLKSQAVSLQAFAPDVSSATAYVINKTLEKDPKNRYQSYEELIEHLEYAREQLLANAGVTGQKSRLILEGDDTAKAMSWITFGIVGVIVLGGVFFYTQRERFKSGEAPIDQRVVEVRKANASVEPQFKAARELLVAGKISEADAALDELATNKSIPQPLLNWVTLHQGMVKLIAGQEGPAKRYFGDIEERGLYSSDPSEQKMANFFVDTARQLTGQFGIQPSVASKYDKGTHEAIALLLFALKDWQMGKFDDAGPLFRQYHSATPQPPYTWVADYKDLAGQYIAAYSDFHTVADQIRAANSIQKQKQAIVAAKASLAGIKVKGKLAEGLQEMVTDLEKKVAATEEDTARKTMMQQEVDTKVLGALRPQFTALCQQLKFNDARIAALAATVGGDAARREQAAMVKKAEWLTKFKATLIADINASPYPQPVIRKNGQVIPGTAARAADLGLEVKTPYGATQVYWTDLSLENMLAMGRFYLKPDLAPEIAANRQWACGVFAFLAGKARDGRDLLIEAAQNKEEYKEALPLFLEFADGQ